jgi:hypothetical protein
MYLWYTEANQCIYKYSTAHTHMHISIVYIYVPIYSGRDNSPVKYCISYSYLRQLLETLKQYIFDFLHIHKQPYVYLPNLRYYNKILFLSN